MLCFIFTEAVIIAKSNIVLDVKPWDDETDMAEVEKAVRSVECDGLLWGACKFFCLALYMPYIYICFAVGI